MQHLPVVEASRNYEQVQSIKWLALWQSIVFNSDDPMDDHREALAYVQLANRKLGPVEQWLRDLTAVWSEGATLYDLYRD